MSYYPYLNDKEFLRLVDQARHKEQFVRIFVLNFNTEEVIASIEGKSTGGSINVSGTSSLRRSGSCSIAVDPAGIEGIGCPLQYSNILEVQNLLSLNKKVRIETGYWNNIEQEFKYQVGSRNYYNDYDIIWLPLGVYIIKNASVSENNSGMNISLTLNDKSAQLNGTCGGIIPAGTVFSEIETLSADGLSRTIEHPLIKDIVRSLVVEFGGEKPDNIIIEDIPDTARKVLKWNGTEPVYLYAGDADGKNKILSTNSELDNCGANTPYLHGQNIGFQQVPFIYPGKLECNAGEAVSSVLDKIKNALGNFEWFYDVFGRFHFQAQKNYLNTKSVEDIKNYTSADYLSVMNMAAPAYSFTDRTLLSSISVAPQYDNIKNDFLVWGTAKTVTGGDKPIRYRLSIDTKPSVRTSTMPAIVYKDYRSCWTVVPTNIDNFVEGKVQTTNITLYNKESSVINGITYYRYNGSAIATIPEGYTIDDLQLIKVINTTTKEVASKDKIQFSNQGSYSELTWWYPQDGGHLSVQAEVWFGKETFCSNQKKYYYDAENKQIYAYDKQLKLFREYPNYYYVQLKHSSDPLDPYVSDWRSELYFRGLEKASQPFVQNPYAAELNFEFPKIYDVLGGEESPVNGNTYIGRYKTDIQESNYEYWIDFLETDSATSTPISQLGVNNIGRRTKVVSDTKVTCLFNTEFPKYMYIEADGYVQDERDMVEPTGYEAIQVAQDVYKNITVGTTANSAYDKIKELIQTHTQYNESVSLTTIPIYYLEPNTLIEVNHDAMGIHGNYLIKSISLPLVPSGTSNISATKCLQKTI